ncbi:centromere/kinetochore protein zw10 homolog [Typha latifolia]|uniref:centromere/kinetochore protein zw10 homolog n=1 Tax=Typha latifolia TaxID=4733 RepID=UPI003C2ABB8E
MDVLRGSIDIRDLLSNPDLLDSDPSSPLSAPDLRLLIDRLNVRSLHIKSQARDYVLSHRRDLVAVFSRCSLASAASTSLSSSISDALRLLSDRPIDLEIRTLAGQIRDARKELGERMEALVVVKSISVLAERLRAAKEDLRAGKVVEAAEVVKKLKAALPVVEGEEGASAAEPVVFGFLRKEWTECFDELQGVLAKNVEDSVQFEPEKGKMIVRSRSSGRDMSRVELHQALHAMEIVDILDYGLAKVADLMIKHVMVPVISNKSITVAIEVLNDDALEEPEAILTLFESYEFQDYQDGSTLYLRLIEIIKFVQKFVCLENGTWMRIFGKLTWPRISDLIITFFLSKAVPDIASKLVDFQAIMRVTTDFEATLRKMMFISADMKEENLSQFVNDVEVHFASKKRSEILAKARNILLRFDYPNSHVTGVAGNSSENVADLLFEPERCFVSNSASQIMKLVHEALKDASVSSARVAKEFYHAARDALLLYKAVVPVKLGKHFRSISQVAIMVHNDFYYLSEEIIGLSFEYRADLPSDLQKHALFVDMAPNFYQMAEDILGEQIQLVLSSLKEAIDGADGFQNTHQSQNYESAKFSIEQVVFILEKVHIMWESYMPAAAYKRTMCVILDFVFSRITRDMLMLDDMAAEETLQLQRLIHLTLENLSLLFKSLIADVDEKEKILNYNLWVQLDGILPSLQKFRKLADLFDMPLKSITTTWETGELINCGFTSSEVENFIKATFADSPLRKECLRRIGGQ